MFGDTTSTDPATRRARIQERSILDSVSLRIARLKSKARGNCR
jgi:hypothetical protein